MDQPRHGTVNMNVYFLGVLALLLVWAAGATSFVVGRDQGYTSAQAAAASAKAAEKAAAQAEAAASRGGAPSTGPFLVGHAAPLAATLLTPTGKPVRMAVGRRATVVMAMATWCKFCGYMDRWVLPSIARLPGVTVDVVDVSATGGIAHPGPRTPPFSGVDSQPTAPLSVTGMERDLGHYASVYQLAHAGIHVYLAPVTTQANWQIEGLPTIAILRPDGTVAKALTGGLPLSQFKADVRAVMAS